MRLFVLVFLVMIHCPLLAEEQSLAGLQKFRQAVEYFRLSNGIRVILYRRPVAPVFAGYISVKVGGVDEPSGKSGISHMLEHMAFKGSSRFGSTDYQREKVLLAELEDLMLMQSAGKSIGEQREQRLAEIRQELEKLWDTELVLDKIYEALGAVDSNATTSADTTNYFLSLPVNAFQVWAEIEAEKILDPVYRQFYKERDVVIEERRMRTDDDPEGKIYEQMLQNAFKVHPYRNPVIGYRQEISALTASETLQFQNKFYVPAKMLIVLVGDLEKSEILPVLEDNFGRIQGESEEVSLTPEPEQKGERKFSVEFDAQPQQVIAWHKPNYPHPDDVPLTVFFEYLLSGNNAPLRKELVIDRKIAYGIDYGEAPGGRYPNLYYLHAIPKSGVSNATLLKEIDEIISRELKVPLSKDRIDVIKRQLLVSSLSGLKSNMGLAGQLAYAEQVFGSWEHMFSWYEVLQQTDADAVRSVAGKYIKNSNRTVGFLETKGK